MKIVVKSLLLVAVLCVSSICNAQVAFPIVGCKVRIGTVYVEQLGFTQKEGIHSTISVLPGLQQVVEGVAQRSNCFYRVLRKDQAGYILSVNITSKTSVIVVDSSFVTQYQATIGVSPQESALLGEGLYGTSSYFSSDEPFRKIKVRQNESVVRALHGAWNKTIRTIVPAVARTN